MLLVVFGAGASYDSYPEVPASGPPVAQALIGGGEDRPPLANQLFDNRSIFVELMEKFKDCQALVPILRQSGISVEKKLAELREQAKTFPHAHRELAAIQYYLHFALWTCQERWHKRHRGITNFATSLREIERWRFETNEQVCFVTFNYDTMLEEAMSQVLHLTVVDMASYTSWENYSLFKLHGSIDWGRVVDGAVRDLSKPIEYLYQRLIDTLTSGSYLVKNRYRLCNLDMTPRLGPDAVLYPALSIPIEKKDEFSCPPDHVTALDALLPDVTKMITIGWRATEAEFLAKLKIARQKPHAGIRNAMDLLVVTGSQEGTQETLTNLLNVGGTSPELFSESSLLFSGGFTGIIRNLGTLIDFLRHGNR